MFLDLAVACCSDWNWVALSEKEYLWPDLEQVSLIGLVNGSYLVAVVVACIVEFLPLM